MEPKTAEELVTNIVVFSGITKNEKRYKMYETRYDYEKSKPSVKRPNLLRKPRDRCTGIYRSYEGTVRP